MNHVANEATTYSTIPHSRRRKIVEVSPEVLLGLLDGTAPGKWWRIPEGQLPDDAQVVGVMFDALGGVWRIAVQSEEFEEISDSTYLPVISLVVVSKLERPE